MGEVTGHNKHFICETITERDALLDSPFLRINGAEGIYVFVKYPDFTDESDGMVGSDEEAILNGKLYIYTSGAFQLAVPPTPPGDALPDTTGNEGKFLKVNEVGVLEWFNIPGGGDMLSANNLSDLTDLDDARKNIGITTSFNATEDIAAYRVVTSTGKVANSNTVAQRNKVIGINVSTVANGFVGQARGQGAITNPSWSWTVGDKIFLNDINLSTTAPSTGFSMYIGTAVASDTIHINLGTPLLL